MSDSIYIYNITHITPRNKYPGDALITFEKISLKFSPRNIANIVNPNTAMTNTALNILFLVFNTNTLTF